MAACILWHFLLLLFCGTNLRSYSWHVFILLIVVLSLCNFEWFMFLILQSMRFRWSEVIWSRVYIFVNIIIALSSGLRWFNSWLFYQMGASIELKIWITKWILLSSRVYHTLAREFISFDIYAILMCLVVDYSLFEVWWYYTFFE